MHTSPADHRPIYWPVVTVVLAGAALRLYSFYFSGLMFNSDGVVYLQQAKALSWGLYDRFTACYANPNIYPFIIAAFHSFINHWVVAAKTASYIFGTATLIPLYLLLREFFDRRVAVCALALAAFNPFFIKYSSDVLRGPVYWFFSSIGLLLVCRALRMKRRSWLYLVGGSIAFTVAAWSRIEAVAYIAATPMFLLFWGRKGRRLKDTLFFLAFFILCGALLSAVMLGKGYGETALMPRALGARLLEAALGYNVVTDGLRALEQLPPYDMPSRFFKEARNMAWLIAIGAGVRIVFIMSFEVFSPFFLMGISQRKEFARRDNRASYLLFTGCAAFCILVLGSINTWWVSSRFAVVVFLPLFIFWGKGMEILYRRLEKKFPAIPSKTLAFVTIALLCVITLPKNLQHYRERKIVFREIGEFVDRQEPDSRVVTIAGFLKEISYSNLYANLSVHDASCYQKHQQDDNMHGSLVSRLRKKGYDYFLWDEKNCTEEELQQLRAANGVQEMASWDGKKKYGRLILFRL